MWMCMRLYCTCNSNKANVCIYLSAFTGMFGNVCSGVCVYSFLIVLRARLTRNKRQHVSIGHAVTKHQWSMFRHQVLNTINRSSIDYKIRIAIPYIDTQGGMKIVFKSKTWLTVVITLTVFPNITYQSTTSESRQHQGITDHKLLVPKAHPNIAANRSHQ